MVSKCNVGLVKQIEHNVFDTVDGNLCFSFYWRKCVDNVIPLFTALLTIRRPLEQWLGAAWSIVTDKLNIQPRRRATAARITNYSHVQNDHRIKVKTIFLLRNICDWTLVIFKQSIKMAVIALKFFGKFNIINNLILKRFYHGNSLI